MSGSIFNLAKRDSKHFVTKGGFEEDIMIKTPLGDVSLNITGFATKHHINFDSDGLPINSKNAHVCIDENGLVSNSYPVRNAKGEIALLKHLVSYADSSGVIKNYVVKEAFPDETLGLIVLILSDYKV
jgi:hypothetical protein